MKIQRILLVAAATAMSAIAQNSDLGLLLGASVSSNSVEPGRIVSSHVHGGGQINYAIQLHETVAGRLYVELPLVITGGSSATVAPGTVSATHGDTIFFTPGVRWKFSPLSRVSFYGAVGGGIGSFEQVYSVVSSKNGVVSGKGRTTTGAIGFGGGLDFRLTRLVSLRGEGRDDVTRGNIDGSAHHGLFMFGVGLHF
jgi:hypothetical protein